METAKEVLAAATAYFSGLNETKIHEVVEPSEDREPDLQQRVEELQKKIEELSRKPRTKKGKTGGKNPEPKRQGQDRNEEGLWRCYNCQEMTKDHIASNCPKQKEKKKVEETKREAEVVVGDLMYFNYKTPKGEVCTVHEGLDASD